jgi:hypothetical protein
MASRVVLAAMSDTVTVVREGELGDHGLKLGTYHSNEYRGEGKLERETKREGGMEGDGENYLTLAPRI